MIGFFDTIKHKDLLKKGYLKVYFETALFNEAERFINMKNRIFHPFQLNAQDCRCRTEIYDKG